VTAALVAETVTVAVTVVTAVAAVTAAVTAVPDSAAQMREHSTQSSSSPLHNTGVCQLFKYYVHCMDASRVCVSILVWYGMMHDLLSWDGVCEIFAYFLHSSARSAMFCRSCCRLDLGFRFSSMAVLVLVLVLRCEL
jgi:hypothetical protein